MNFVETESPLNGIAKTFVCKEENSTCIMEFTLNFDGTIKRG
jgi:hypothetical protein